MLLGAQGGLRYQQSQRHPPTIQGRSRLQGSFALATGNATGAEMRVGSFLGPAWSFLALETGPDVFWNKWSLADLELVPSLGVAWTLGAAVPMGPITLWAGMAPAWLAEKARRVDWSSTSTPGFGDEMTYDIGATVAAGRSAFSLGYTHQVVAGGTLRGISFGARMY